MHTMYANALATFTLIQMWYEESTSQDGASKSAQIVACSC